MRLGFRRHLHGTMCGICRIGFGDWRYDIIRSRADGWHQSCCASSPCLQRLISEIVGKQGRKSATLLGWFRAKFAEPPGNHRPKLGQNGIVGPLGEPLGSHGAPHGNPLGPLGTFWGHWEGFGEPDGCVLGQIRGKMRSQSEPKCDPKRHKIKSGNSK